MWEIIRCFNSYINHTQSFDEEDIVVSPAELKSSPFGWAVYPIRKAACPILTLPHLEAVEVDQRIFILDS